ncbi:alkaline phosphatase family protein [Mesorhizobium sp. LSHC414A00]|uniref:alkaline phosphatase family protein n=1 Tax=Mesorhizobium sp. LSHC414A00 TaxID=1287287 RepID=UPI0003CF2AB5|nr:alkaline phosphatase family protein [Mesorhizobium sp. LSHC414A00]ESX79994.1 hypothetical protein X757_03235 [Mesorhizobium sp. LSHC414A00]
MPLAIDLPSITTFRARLQQLLADSADTGDRRHVLVLAIDGIPLSLAEEFWPESRIDGLRSVFPTTSSTAWLSSLTGQQPEQHGIPGVVFRDDSGHLVNVFEYRGAFCGSDAGNIFSDAAALEYWPVAILGDWEPYECTWRTMLLKGAHLVEGHRFYTAAPANPGAMRDRVHGAIQSALERLPPGQPSLLWCFIDADRHVHRRGYDSDLVHWLSAIDDLAADFASRGFIVVAHSDHGLVRTVHDPEIVSLLAGIEADFGCEIGGAGRTRWIYAGQSDMDRVVSALERSLPSTVRLFPADLFFRPGSLARARSGDLMLVAQGDEFMTFSGHIFDHGSLTETELRVPFAVWSANSANGSQLR